MLDLVCKRDSRLTPAEKRVFEGDLERQGLADNVWGLFGEWVSRSTAEVSFFYLKVHSGNDLLGLGMFVQIKPFDLRASYSRLRKAGMLNKLGALISRLSNNCVVVSFRNLITRSNRRPWEPCCRTSSQTERQTWLPLSTPPATSLGIKMRDLRCTPLPLRLGSM